MGLDFAKSGYHVIGGLLSHAFHVLLFEARRKEPFRSHFHDFMIYKTPQNPQHRVQKASSQPRERDVSRCGFLAGPRANDIHTFLRLKAATTFSWAGRCHTTRIHNAEVSHLRIPSIDPHFQSWEAGESP